MRATTDRSGAVFTPSKASTTRTLKAPATTYQPAPLKQTAVFLKKPSALKALKDPKAYMQDLKRFKNERATKHFHRLLTELGSVQPNLQNIKKECAKLATCGGVKSTIGGMFSVPSDKESQDEWLEQVAAGKRGIDSILPQLAGGHTKEHLCGVGQLLEKFGPRVEEVNSYREKKAAALEKLSARTGTFVMNADVEDANSARNEPPAAEQWNISKNGTNGAILKSTTKPRTRRATLFAGRRENSQDAYDTVPKVKDVRQLNTVLKVESDPTACDCAMYLYGVMDHLSQNATNKLPFSFPVHTIGIKKDADQDEKSGLQRADLLKKIQTELTHLEAKKVGSYVDQAEINTLENPIKNLRKMQQAMEEKAPVLAQEGLSGSVVADATLLARNNLFTTPSLCRDIGKSLIVAPMLGLGDHLSVSGLGSSNNWTNVITENQDLKMFDLSTRALGLSDGAFLSAKSLISSLHQLAEQIGADDTLPGNWEETLAPHLTEFLQVTFTVDGGLFTRKDFMTPQMTENYRAANDTLNLYKTLYKAFGEAMPNKVADANEAWQKITTAIKEIENSGKPLPEPLESMIDELTVTPFNFDLSEAQLKGLREKLTAVTGPLQDEIRKIERDADTRGNTTLEQLKQKAAGDIIVGLVAGMRYVSTNRQALIKAHTVSNVGNVLGAVGAEEVNRMADIFDRLSPNDVDKLLKVKSASSAASLNTVALRA